MNDSEWLEFNVEEQISIPSKHWWQKDKIQTNYNVVKIKKSEIAVIKPINENKTKIWLKAGCIYINALVSYEKLTEMI